MGASHQCSTTCLGFVITPKSVAMDLQKLEALCNWPLPKLLKLFQRFLGFANFFDGSSRTAVQLQHLLPLSQNSLPSLVPTLPLNLHPSPS